MTVRTEVPISLPRRKWVHPLKGRTIKQAMADALDEACMDEDGKGMTFDESQFWKNHPSDICYGGAASWGYTYVGPEKNPVHSWDSMRDCLKYGFTVGDDGCVVAVDTDWNQKQLMEEK
jgi:hypothetical protein